MSQRLPAATTANFPSLRSVDVAVVSRTTLLGRIHAQTGPHPSTWSQFRFFGPTGSRFDHQPPPARNHPSRGILYAALRTPSASILATCVLEVGQDRLAVELSRDHPYFVVFRPTRDLRLLDLTSSWVARAGGNAAIASGLRSTARGWSRKIYARYPDLDGVRYGCSLNPAAVSIALYERAVTAMPARPEAHVPLSHPALRAELEAAAADFRLELFP